MSSIYRIGEQLLFQLKHSLEATRDSRDAQELIEILQSPNFQVFREVFFISYTEISYGTSTDVLKWFFEF